MADLTPTLLLILDGWGVAPASEGNAVTLAATPTLDRLLAEYPSTRLNCSGRAVGLPDGFMGNSEVGHMNIGAGRVVYQFMTRIDMAIEEGTFGQQKALQDLFASAKASGGRLHLMGLVSDGGVHSHINHLFAMLRLAKAQGVETFVHCFMDGRDTAPDSGAGFIAALQAQMDELGHGRIASITGRYYAMDRDKRWERSKLAYDALTQGEGMAVAQDNPEAVVREAYTSGETDEFIKPRVLTDDGEPVALIEDGDAVFFFNFRADRARQLTRMLFDGGFSEVERAARPALCNLSSMTKYEDDFPLPVAFPPVEIANPLGEVVANMGRKQLRIAETEKYAHVTYFFNCGREKPYEGEERKMVPSPREVATYDEKPQMSAPEVTDYLVDALARKRFSLIVCNLANLDMVGHTGVIPAARMAVETVDACVARIVEAAQAAGGRVLMTADHGNAEEMLTAEGKPMTAHSLNQVPFVYIEQGHEDAMMLPEGQLGDMATTILGLWGVTPPEEMTGKCLVEIAE